MTPLPVKIWLGGAIPLWLLAKVHTLRTWDSGRYLELHWPFWAAMIVWASIVFGIDRYVSRPRERHDYEIREIEVGFLSRDGHETSHAGQFRIVHVPDLAVGHVQFWRLAVREAGGRDREQLLLMGHFPPLPPDIRAAVAALAKPLFPQAVLSFTLDDAEGWSTIDAQEHAIEAAVAIAEVKRRGSWDESPVFQVTAGAETFAVRLRWRKDRTEARVSEGGSKPAAALPPARR